MQHNDYLMRQLQMMVDLVQTAIGFKAEEDEEQFEQTTNQLLIEIFGENFEYLPENEIDAIINNLPADYPLIFSFLDILLTFFEREQNEEQKAVLLYTIKSLYKNHLSSYLFPDSYQKRLLSHFKNMINLKN